jgi:hypothetical protein
MTLRFRPKAFLGEGLTKCKKLVPRAFLHFALFSRIRENMKKPSEMNSDGFTILFLLLFPL